MQSRTTSLPTNSVPSEAVRLHYLDWLRVPAILVVFLFHAVHPSDFGNWQVKNIDQSEILTIILLSLSLWGMPFFFLVAGASNWLALQRRTTRAVRGDWPLLLTAGCVIMLGVVGIYLVGLPVLTWYETPEIPEFYTLQVLHSAIATCFSLMMLFIGMCFLDFTNKWVRYGQEAALPFFVLHQPVIIIIAFFVVQWSVGIWIKLLIVVLSSFIVSISLYELIIWRIRSIRLAFAMKSQRLGKT